MVLPADYHMHTPKLAADLRVPITFGSDAHAPGEVGLNLTEAVTLARKVAYTHCCRLSKRKRTAVALLAN